MTDGLERSRATRDETCAYIMDLLAQLARMAEQAGDEELALQIFNVGNADERLRAARTG